MRAADTPMTMSVTDIDFGKVNTGETRTVSVTLTNSGTDSFGPINVIGGTPATTEFTVSQDCQGATVQAGGSCNFSYSFSPRAPGFFTNISSFNVSETPNPGDGEGFSVGLRGAGVSPITAAPLTHDFGNVIVGLGSTNPPTVVTNTGSQSFGPIHLFGEPPPSSPFAASQGCQGATLLPGWKCFISFSFTPTAPGVVNDSFDISLRSSDFDEVHFIVNLAGCGTADGSPCPHPAEHVATVIPVVGSTPGNFGSFFRTGVQLSHSSRYSTNPITGRFVFHPSGVSASPTDPSLDFTVSSESTVSFDDLVETMGQSGLGTIDVVVPEGRGAPYIVARVYNDAGIAGTSGFTEESISTTSDYRLLQSGAIALLVAPPNNTSLRFNIGVRTMSFGASLAFRIRDANGALIHTVTKHYGPNFHEQHSAEVFLGVPLPPDASIEITGGGAIVYGATIDNVTNDPSIQFARVIGFIF